MNTAIVTWAKGLLGAAALVLFASAPAFAEDLRLAPDQVAPIRVNAAVAGVAIGNENVAAVSVQDDQLLFLTGRGYGVTNIVVVGEDGRVLFSGRVTVAAEEQTGAVIVTRGLESSRLLCAPTCRPDTDTQIPAQ